MFSYRFLIVWTDPLRTPFSQTSPHFSLGTPGYAFSKEGIPAHFRILCRDYTISLKEPCSCSGPAAPSTTISFGRNSGICVDGHSCRDATIKTTIKDGMLAGIPQNYVTCNQGALYMRAAVYNSFNTVVIFLSYLRSRA